MRVLQFTVENYRGITKPLRISLEKTSLIPIIGINECGKTTLLESILAIDYSADSNNSGRHLSNTNSLYQYAPPPALVSTLVRTTSKGEIDRIIRSVIKDSGIDERTFILRYSPPSIDKIAIELIARMSHQTTAATNEAPAIPSVDDDSAETVANRAIATWIAGIRSVADSQVQFKITRNLLTMKYTIESKSVPSDPELQHRIGRATVRQMPFIVYFDDFRHAVPEIISLDPDAKTEWSQMLEQLFRRANPELNVFSLGRMEHRLRKSAIAAAERELQETLTRQWQTFNLEDSGALSIRLNYHDIKPHPSISLDVVEHDKDSRQHYFSIQDRSKGFYWFFNFVMRIEYNPKARSSATSEQQGAIYLLDEPGSYLHASAQQRLCKKLRQISLNNPVLFTTHSHHLLDPQTIPVTNVLIAEKGQTGAIGLRSISQISDEEASTQRLAFQPIFEALQLSPSALNLRSERIMVVEGMYDFFAYDMFKQADALVVPAVGADSLRFVISFLTASGTDYRALWDNDKAGMDGFAAAAKHFGDEAAKIHFRLLPTTGGKKRILQDLFAGDDLSNWRSALGLPDNSNFKKVVLSAYYSPKRQELLDSTSTGTKSAFAAVFESLWTKAS